MLVYNTNGKLKYPIIPELFSILFSSDYSQNYSGIIDACLNMSPDLVRRIASKHNRATSLNSPMLYITCWDRVKHLAIIMYIKLLSLQWLAVLANGTIS